MMADIKQIALIVLAAGKSSRMGHAKGLLAYGEHKFWLTEQLERFHTAGGLHAVVVLGYDHALYERAFSIPKNDPAEVDIGRFKVNFVRSHAPELGPLLSLQTGIAALDHQGIRGFLVLPVDVPLMGASSLKLLASAMAGNSLVVKPTFAGKSGHPIILSVDFAKQILNLDLGPTSRLDRLIEKLPAQLVSTCAVSESDILTNLNCAADWQQYINKQSRPAP